MTTRLWELSDEIQELEQAINAIANDETLNEEERETKLQSIFDKWLNTGESFNSKAEQVASYIKHQEAIANARKAEAKRIQTLAKHAENEAIRLRKYLIVQMLRSDTKTINGTLNKIGLRRKQPEVLIKIPVEKLPREYLKIIYQPNLQAIRRSIKSDDIDWAYLSEEDRYSVTIR